MCRCAGTLCRIRKKVKRDRHDAQDRGIGDGHANNGVPDQIKSPLAVRVLSSALPPDQNGFDKLFNIPPMVFESTASVPRFHGRWNSSPSAAMKQTNIGRLAPSASVHGQDFQHPDRRGVVVLGLTRIPLFQQFSDAAGIIGDILNQEQGPEDKHRGHRAQKEAQEKPEKTPLHGEGIGTGQHGHDHKQRCHPAH